MLDLTTAAIMLRTSEHVSIPAAWPGVLGAAPPTGARGCHLDTARRLVRRPHGRPDEPSGRHDAWRYQVPPRRPLRLTSTQAPWAHGFAAICDLTKTPMLPQTNSPGRLKAAVQPAVMAAKAAVVMSRRLILTQNLPLLNPIWGSRSIGPVADTTLLEPTDWRAAGVTASVDELLLTTSETCVLTEAESAREVPPIANIPNIMTTVSVPTATISRHGLIRLSICSTAPTPFLGGVSTGRLGFSRVECQCHPWVRQLVGENPQHTGLVAWSSDTHPWQVDSQAMALRGQVISAWRSYAGVRPAELARRASLIRSSKQQPAINRAAITYWEQGKRSADTSEMKAVMEALELPYLEGRAFLDMWRSAGAITDGLPHRNWWWNFQLPSRPCWIWIRPQEPGRLSIRAWWGEAFQGSGNIEVGAAGLIVESPTSVPNPAVHVTLDVPGWVHFGVGLIPDLIADALGSKIVDGRVLMHVTEPNSPPVDANSERILRKLLRRLEKTVESASIGWHFLTPHMGLARSDRAPHPLDGNEVDPPVGQQSWYTTEGDKARVLAVSPGQLQRMRESRGFTRAEVADEVSMLDPSLPPVTARMVEHLETRGQLPAAHHFLPRLDMIYQADGRLGLERLSHGTARTLNHHWRSRDRVRVEFPYYWIGPIWIQAGTGTDAPSGVVDLIWGQWRTQRRIRPGDAITTRKSVLDGPPLHLRVPPGWWVSVGLGAPPTALDINRGWWPANILAAKSLLLTNIDAVGRVFPPVRRRPESDWEMTSGQPDTSPPRSR